MNFIRFYRRKNLLLADFTRISYDFTRISYDFTIGFSLLYSCFLFLPAIDYSHPVIWKVSGLITVTIYKSTLPRSSVVRVAIEKKQEEREERKEEELSEREID